MNTSTPCYLSDALTNPATPLAADEVDVDSYAIVPASTLFTQIVPVVLRKLGYGDDVIFNANGAPFTFHDMQIKFFQSVRYQQAGSCSRTGAR